MNLLYKAGREIIRLYSRLMLNLDIRWNGEIPAGPKIFVANHPSATDAFILHLLSREPMSVMIASTAFTFPLFGEYIRRAGQIQVLPGDGARAMEQAKEFLKAGYSVGIFPEGDFSPQAGGFRQPVTARCDWRLVRACRSSRLASICHASAACGLPPA